MLEVPRPSLAEKVFDELSALIRNCEIPPGTQLTEREITERFSISRTPVREALKHLEQDGLIEAASPSGFRVTAIDLKSIAELYRIRETLEQMVVDEVINNRESRSFLDLRERVALSPMAEGHDDSFHEALLEVAQNQELTKILGEIYNRIQPYRILDGNSRRESVELDHKLLVELLAEANSAAAKEIMQHHIESAQSSVKNLLSAGVKSISFNPSAG
jgi:DNA-binding GntR family transcriptional regulator